MAGSIATTVADVGGGCTRYPIAWTSDASGNVSGDSFPIKFGGLLQAKFVPGTSGVQPTDQYDVVVNDADGVDVLRGAGANLSNSAGSYSTPVNNAPVLFLEAQTLYPVVSNAGNAKSGTIILYQWL